MMGSMAHKLAIEPGFVSMMLLWPLKGRVDKVVILGKLDNLRYYRIKH